MGGSNSTRRSLVSSGSRPMRGSTPAAKTRRSAASSMGSTSLCSAGAPAAGSVSTPGGPRLSSRRNSLFFPVSSPIHRPGKVRPLASSERSRMSLRLRSHGNEPPHPVLEAAWRIWRRFSSRSAFFVLGREESSVGASFKASLCDCVENVMLPVGGSGFGWVLSET